MMPPDIRAENHAPTCNLIAGLIACIGAALAGDAVRASGAPVIDNALNAQVAEQITTARNQLSELTRMKQLAQQQVATIGEFGTMGDLFSGTTLESSGSKTDFYDNMKAFAFDPCAINLCRVGDNPVGTTDLEEATDWAMRNFYSSVPLNESQARDLGEVRRRAAVYSAINGLALSNVVHNDLAGAGETASSLEAIVEASTSLRGDVRANSAIALATYEIEIKKLAALTAMLHVTSANAVSETSSYHEDGGTEFPDAFIDDDYAFDGNTERLKVTVPERGSPSGGGGFGGGLFTSIASGVPGGTDIAAALASSGLDVGSLGLPEGLDIASLDTADVLADATSMARRVVETSGGGGVAAALETLERAQTRGGWSGIAGTQLGAAAVEAASAGNPRLGETLRLAETLTRNPEPDTVASFARGAAAELRAQGVQNAYLSYIEDQARALSRGDAAVAPEDLVMDVSSMLATFDTGQTGRAADILRQAPEDLDSEGVRDLVADTIARANGGDAETLRVISDGVRALDTAPPATP